MAVTAAAFLFSAGMAGAMHAQGSGCVPPNVSVEVLVAPVVAEALVDVSPYGPVLVLDILWEGRVVWILVVGSELAYFDPDATDDNSKPWLREDPTSCNWTRPGVTGG